MASEHKTLLTIIAVGLFLIELEIFAVAAMKTGRKSRIQVFDGRQNLVYEVDGGSLTKFDKYYFEKNFGPVENYDIRLKTFDVPFPFRAWFVAAAGLPIALVLLFAFVVKAWTALFSKAPEPDAKAPEPDPEKVHQGRLEQLIAKVSRLNIFAIGFMVFAGLFAYWVIPNLIARVSQLGFEVILRFKWFFLGAALFIAGVCVWIIYLRYLLAKKTIETRADLEKYKLELEWDQQKSPIQYIEYVKDEANGEISAAGDSPAGAGPDPLENS